MAFCTNCGNAVPDGAASCPVCGAALYNANAGAPSYEATAAQQTPVGGYYSPQYQQTPPADPYSYQQPYYQQAAPANLAQKNEVSTAKTLGVLCIVFAFLNTLVSIILGCIGISKAGTAIQNARMYNDQFLIAEAEQAKRYNKIGLIINAVFMGIAILAFILLFALGAAGVISEM